MNPERIFLEATRETLTGFDRKTFSYDPAVWSQRDLGEAWKEAMQERGWHVRKVNPFAR